MWWTINGASTCTKELYCLRVHSYWTKMIFLKAPSSPAQWRYRNPLWALCFRIAHQTIVIHSFQYKLCTKVYLDVSRSVVHMHATTNFYMRAPLMWNYVTQIALSYFRAWSSRLVKRRHGYWMLALTRASLSLSFSVFLPRQLSTYQASIRSIEWKLPLLAIKRAFERAIGLWGNLIETTHSYARV